MSIEVTGIDGVINGMEGLVKGYNKETSKFLNKEGGKLKAVIKKNAKKELNRKTGNYLEGITKGKPYQYYKSSGGKAKDSIKVYGKRPPAYHTHLIEDGHEKVLWGNRTAERVRAFYIYKKSQKEYESKFENDCEEFVEKALASLLW